MICYDYPNDESYYPHDLALLFADNKGFLWTNRNYRSM